MEVLAGKIIEEFGVGKEFIKIRYPKFEDYPDLMEFINSLIEEGVYIILQKKVNKKQEVEFIADLLKKIENKEVVALVVEVNGKVKGLADIHKKKDRERHVGVLGISLKKEIRGKGLGKKLMQTVIKEAKKKLKIKLVMLDVVSKNKIAYNLYKKLGFEEVGVIKKGYKKEDNYYDRIIMVKYL